MKISILFNLLITMFVSSVEGFAPLSTVVNKQCSSGRTNTYAGLLSASQDSNQGESKAVDETVDGEELDDYDFEAGFQERLKKEGGVTGIKVKAAKRSVDSVTRGVTGSVQSNLGLLSISGWSLTVGFLALVVVLAIGTHFASPQPFETSTNGEQLGFGVR
jgi:hypothetical protein